jgi:hypothetical protein
MRYPFEDPEVAAVLDDIERADREWRYWRFQWRVRRLWRFTAWVAVILALGWLVEAVGLA